MQRIRNQKDREQCCWFIWSDPVSKIFQTAVVKRRLLVHCNDFDCCCDDFCPCDSYSYCNLSPFLFLAPLLCLSKYASKYVTYVSKLCSVRPALPPLGCALGSCRRLRFAHARCKNPGWMSFVFKSFNSLHFKRRQCSIYKNCNSR